MSIQLTRDFADALGLPKNTTRAVLVLEVGKLPTLHIQTLLTDQARSVTAKRGSEAAAGIKRIAFKVRLEPYDE